jgi:mannose-6-phosphate isomerase-like protein (cupin superfamily)
MATSGIIDLDKLDWIPVRPDAAGGVVGKPLLDAGIKAVFTRVAPGGGFSPHRDAYAHLMYFLSGSGEINIEGKGSDVGAGTAAYVAPGDEHSYRNTGLDDLMLLSFNLPDLAEAGKGTDTG